MRTLKCEFAHEYYRLTRNMEAEEFWNKLEEGELNAEEVDTVSAILSLQLAVDVCRETVGVDGSHIDTLDSLITSFKEKYKNLTETSFLEVNQEAEKKERTIEKFFAEIPAFQRDIVQKWCLERKVEAVLSLPESMPFTLFFMAGDLAIGSASFNSRTVRPGHGYFPNHPVASVLAELAKKLKFEFDTN